MYLHMFGLWSLNADCGTETDALCVYCLISLSQIKDADKFWRKGDQFYGLYSQTWICFLLLVFSMQQTTASGFSSLWTTHCGGSLSWWNQYKTSKQKKNALLIACNNKVQSNMLHPELLLMLCHWKVAAESQNWFIKKKKKRERRTSRTSQNTWNWLVDHKKLNC